jgi:hypothetical protein
MKQLLLLALLLIGHQSFTNAATASGVISTGYGTPTAGVHIIVRNGLTAARVTSVTGGGGMYSIAIPSTWANGPVQIIDSNACSWSVRLFSYSGNNLVWNDTLCDSIDYSLSGRVMKQGGPAANAKVYLFTADTVITPAKSVLLVDAVDSMVTDATGNYKFVRTLSVFARYQRILAKLQPSDPDYAAYVPTYHDSALIWHDDPGFTAQAWLDNRSDLDVKLQPLINTVGTGFIGGYVIAGPRHASSAGIGLNGRVVMLMDIDGRVTGYTRSDPNGQFFFGNLPMGLYFVFGDSWGRENPKLKVLISTAQHAMNNLIFQKDSSVFHGRLGALAVSNKAMDQVCLYPNPAKDYMMLDGLSGIAGDKTIMLCNMMGSMLSRTEVATGNSYRIAVNTLTPGVYMLMLQTAAGTASYRFMKE